METAQLLERAQSVKTHALTLTAAQKNQILSEMADALLENAQRIMTANEQDMQKAKSQISETMLDRLMLNFSRIEGMAQGLRALTLLEDPIGQELSHVQRPNGLVIRRVRVPMGVVAVIYESRPNVTSDAAGLCLKSGNVCVLRGGKEALATNREIVKALHAALERTGHPCELVQLVEDTGREGAAALMQARGKVDLLIPRGGKGLIQACVEQAKVPCIETGTGICHIYVDEAADLSMALEIVDNAKTSRPSVCNAAEVCLVHASCAEAFLPMLKERMELKHTELRLCPRAAKIIEGTPAGPQDFDTEFLDYVLAVKVVEDLPEALAHIRSHSTGHSEAIVTSNEQTAQRFMDGVDSAAVYVNASTRFTDGGEFGLGCEMGISTQKLGARGPMGLCELTSYQYRILGSGQVR